MTDIIANEELKEEIAELFHGKDDCGIYITQNYSRGSNIRSAGETVTPDYIDNLIFSHAARFFNQFSVPVNYTNKFYPHALFGENIKSVDESQLKCAIIDLYAAEFLYSRGIDVGIKSVGEKCSFRELYSPDLNEYAANSITTSKKLDVNENCKVRLRFESEADKTPAVYSYVNKKGQSFLVFNFDSAFTDRRALRNYLLQEALINGIENISGEKLPVKCPKNPDLYVIAKRKGKKIAVGAWNCSCDEIIAPEFTLPDTVKNAKFVNTDGIYKESAVITNSIAPFSFCCFEAEI